MADFNEKKADWVDRDLYAFVLDLSGKVLAHSTNSKLVGKDMIEVADVDGKYFTKEVVDVVKASGKGWVDYKFTDPATKKWMPMSSYCEKVVTLACAWVHIAADDAARTRRVAGGEPISSRGRPDDAAGLHGALPRGRTKSAGEAGAFTMRYSRHRGNGQASEVRARQ